MTKIVLFIAVSLDGYIAKKDGGLDWLPQPDPNNSDGEDYGYNEFYESIDALAIGSATYEQIL